MRRSERRFVSKLTRYIGTGGVAAVIDIGGFWLLDRLRVTLPLAATTSFCVAAVVNYLLSSRLVFNRSLTWRGFILFFSVALIGLCVNVGVTVVGFREFHLLPALAKITAVGIAFIINFTLNLTVVFKRVK